MYGVGACELSYNHHRVKHIKALIFLFFFLGGGGVAV